MIIRLLVLLMMVIGSATSAFAADEAKPDQKAEDFSLPDEILNPDTVSPGGGIEGFDKGFKVEAIPGQEVTYDLKYSADGVKPGGEIVIAIVADIAPGWHMQTSVQKMIGGAETIPFKVDFTQAPKGLRFGDIQWPEEHLLEIKLKGDNTEKATFYSGKAVTFVKMNLPNDAKLGELLFTIETEHQVCDDNNKCLLPTVTTHEIKINVLDKDTNITKLDETLFAKYKGATGASSIVSSLNFDLFGLSFGVAESSFLLILIVAGFGGFLLNLTPCVLPMVPIKIMGFSKAAHGDRKRCLWLGVVMCFGVIAFWMILGSAIAFLSGFSSTNQLFQYPWFSIGVGLFIVAMAIGMCGFFTIQLPQAVYMVNPSQDTARGSFIFGIMTAVLSTPCTAPFMGTAAAWAAGQHPAKTLIVFAAIGAGMALPYLILAAFPKLVSKVPRTGPASELIKQVMGLLMLAAGLYFVGTGLSGMLVTAPDPPSLFYWWVVTFTIAGAGGWLAWKTLKITRSAGRRIVFGGFGLFLLVAGLYGGVRMTDPGPIKWVYFTPERLDDALNTGDVVVIDFTAEWCINCKTLERTVLYTDRVSKILNGDGVTPIKIDLTGNNEVGNAKLAAMGRRSIPLLVVLDSSGNEVFKGDFYTPQQVIDAVEKAKGARANRPPETSFQNVSLIEDKPRKEVDKTRAGLPDGFDGAKTVVYKTVGDIPLKMHLFYPKDHKADDKPRPAIIFFFGGGWVGGTPAQFQAHCEYLASRGMIAATAEYRVKKRHGTTPYECVKDGKSAVRYLRKNAKKLGIDPKRIAAGGGSAGGHVAASTGTIIDFNNDGDPMDVSPVPNAMVLFNPVLDTSAKGFGRKDRKDISPVHHITDKTVPTLIFHGDADTTVPIKQAEMFVKNMKAKDRRGVLHVYPGEKHGFFNKGRGDGKAYYSTIRQMDAFLKSLGYLEGEPTIKEDK